MPLIALCIGALGCDAYIHSVSAETMDLLSAADSQGKVAIVSPTGSVLGFADPAGKIIDSEGNNIGYIDKDGVAWDLLDRKIGSVSRDKQQVNKRYVEDKIGNFCGNGVKKVINPDGYLIGCLRADGKVFDAYHKNIGYVDKDGIAFDLNGELIGIVASGSKLRYF